MFRRSLYTTIIAPYQNPKKIPKTEEKFMPLSVDEKTETISDEAISLFNKKMKAYKDKQNGGKVSTAN